MSPTSTPKRRRGPSRAYSPGAPRQIRCKCQNPTTKWRLIKCPVCQNYQHIVCMAVTGKTTNYKCEVCAPRGEVEISSSATPSEPKNMRKWSSLSPENEKIVDFFEKKSIDIQVPWNLTKKFEEFKVETNGKNSPTNYRSNFRRCLSTKIHKLDGLDDEQKARILYATGTPVEEKLLERLKSVATVKVDSQRRLTYFKSKNLHFAGKHAEPRGRKIKSSKIYSNPSSDDDDDHENHVELLSTGPFCTPIPIKQEILDYSTQEMVPQGQFFDPNYSNPAAIYSNPPPPSAYCTPMNYSNPYCCNPANQMFQGLMSSLSELVNSQTEFMKQMTRKSSLSPNNSSASTSSTVTSVGSAHSSVSEFLKYIQSSIIKWDNLQLSDVLQKIVINLQNIGSDGDQRCPEARMKMALESAFSIGTSGSISNGAHLQSAFVDAKEFYNMILMYASTQQLYGLCEQIKQKIDGLDGSETIPIVMVRTALEAAIGIIMQ